MVLSLLGGTAGIVAGAAASLGLSYMGGWQSLSSRCGPQRKLSGSACGASR